MIGGTTRRTALALAVMLAVLSTGSYAFATDDVDGDGLLDSWELQFFGDLGQEAHGDFDGDGFTNLEEFSAGTDPTDSMNKPNPPRDEIPH
ncbi:MAG: thrombospondin type 3 repeat-containing protein [Thermoplasmata archaeon]